MTKTYESPEVTDHGSLEDLTLQDKTAGSSDGFTLNGSPIRNAS